MRDFSTQISFFRFLMSFMPTGARGLGSHHRARKYTATTYYIKRLSAKTTHCLVSLACSHNQLMGNTCFEGLLRFVRNFFAQK